MSLFAPQMWARGPIQRFSYIIGGSSTSAGTGSGNIGTWPETVLLVVLLLAARLSGSGSDEARRTVRLRGAGGSFPKAVYDEWINAYSAGRYGYVKLDMTYKSVGSTAGKQAMMGQSNMDVDYAASDYDLSADEKRKYPDLRLFPTMAGAIVFGYNLELDTNQSLVLSLDVAVGIYNGTYEYWNDTALQALNRNVRLPGERIVVIARGDSSGTTRTVTAAFSSVAGWQQRYGTFTSGLWDSSVIAYLAQKNRGMAGLLLSLPNSIGYLVVADAVEAGLEYAHMLNQFGNVVSPTQVAVQVAMDKAAEIIEDELTVDLSNHQLKDSYPIATFTYMIVRMNMRSCSTAEELLRYIHWFTTDDSADNVCSRHNMVPLSSSIATRIEELVLYQLTCGGRPLWPVVKQQLRVEQEERRGGKEWVMPTIVGVAMAGLVVIGIGIYAAVSHIRRNRKLDADEWDIPIEDIVFYTTAKSATSGKSRFVMWSSIRSLTDVEEVDDGFQMLKHILQWPGKWNGLNVGLRLLEIKSMANVSRPTKKLLLSMRDHIIHNNVLNFYGLAELQGDRYVVSDYCSKGPLDDLLKDDKYLLNKECKFAISLEIINGLYFLHSHSITHGHLRSSSCLVDFKWTVKIADWEYCHLYTHLNPKRNPLLALRKTPDEVGKDSAAVLDFWTAPELLRAENNLHPSPACDLYSYAIILQEIFTRRNPYSEYFDTMSPSDLIKAIMSNSLRPSHGENTPIAVRQVMECCWAENSTIRPSSEQVMKMVKSAHNPKRSSVLDYMVEASEEYTSGLEEQLQLCKEQLGKAEKRVARLTDLRIPPPLQQRLSASNSTREIEFTSSVCILALRAASCSRATHRKGKERPVHWLNASETRIQEVAARYGCTVINYTCGVYLLIYGIGSKEKRKAIQATRLAFEIITNEPDANAPAAATAFTASTVDTMAPPGQETVAEDNSVGSVTPSCSSSTLSPPTVSYRVVLHHGSIYTGLVQDTEPRCHIMGEALEEAHILLRHSHPGHLLVSRAFKDALTIFAVDHLRMEANPETVAENGHPNIGETYWLFKKVGLEHPKWTGVLSRTVQAHRLRSASRESLSPHVRPRGSSTNSGRHLAGDGDDEVPIARLATLLDGFRDMGHKNKAGIWGDVAATPDKDYNDHSQLNHLSLRPSVSLPSHQDMVATDWEKPSGVDRRSHESIEGDGGAGGGGSSGSYRGSIAGLPSWGSMMGRRFRRSRSFTAGTIASLRHLLSRTLPPPPSYKMNVISNDERISDNFEEPSLDALPV